MLNTQQHYLLYVWVRKFYYSSQNSIQENFHVRLWREPSSWRIFCNFFLINLIKRKFDVWNFWLNFSKLLKRIENSCSTSLTLFYAIIDCFTPGESMYISHTQCLFVLFITFAFHFICMYILSCWRMLYWCKIFVTMIKISIGVDCLMT